MNSEAQDRNTWEMIPRVICWILTPSLDLLGGLTERERGRESGIRGRASRPWPRFPNINRLGHRPRHKYRPYVRMPVPALLKRCPRDCSRLSRHGDLFYILRNPVPSGPSSHDQCVPPLKTLTALSGPPRRSPVTKPADPGRPQRRCSSATPNRARNRDLAHQQPLTFRPLPLSQPSSDRLHHTGRPPAGRNFDDSSIFPRPDRYFSPDLACPASFFAPILIVRIPGR